MSDDMLESMELWLQSRMEDVHTMLPGTVQSYDPDTRTAVVKPSVKLRTMHGDILDIPPIASVPVVWPGSNDFTAMSKDLPKGSGVTLLFSEASLGNWQRGSQDAAAEDESRHSLQDAIAVPGLWSMRRVPGHELSTADWGMCSSSLEIGGTKSGLVSIKNQTTDLHAEIDKIWTAMSTLRADLAAQFTALSAVTTSPAALVPVGPATPLTTSLLAQATAQTAAIPALTADQLALGGLLA